MSDLSLSVTRQSSVIWLVLAAGSVGILVSSTGGRFASLGAAAFLLFWILVLAMRGQSALQAAIRTPALLALPALALCSTLWSYAPGATLRAAIQLSLTAGFAILAARLLPPRAFVSAILVSLTIGAMLCLAFGRYLPDPFTGTMPFVGIFASKNSMAFFMALLVIFGMAAAVDRGQGLLVRAVGALGLALAAPLLILANSAGALVTTLLAVVIFFLGMGARYLRRSERRILLTASVVMMLPLGVVLVGLAAAGTIGEAANDFIVGVLGKDLTLTGRTTLWAHAWAQIEQRPLFGAGYQAFWQQGNPWAEGLWRMFQIRSRSGFHFHNTFIDTTVGLGAVGAVAITALLVMGALRCVRLVLDDPQPAKAALLATSTCLLLRAFVEVDATYPFAIGTFLVFAIGAYGKDLTRQAQGRELATGSLRLSS